MKRTKIKEVVMLLLLGVAACGMDPEVGKKPTDKEGKFSVSLKTNGEFNIVANQNTAAQSIEGKEMQGRAITPDKYDVSDFNVQVSGLTLTDTKFEQAWSKYSDMESVVTIPAGKYTIEAFNGEQQTGFDTPYFYGSTEFTVGIQDIANVQVTCQLACVGLTVKFTDLFLSLVKEPRCIVSHIDGETGTHLEFNESNLNRDGYISAPVDGRLMLTVRGVDKNDPESKIEKTYFIENVKAKEWHTITLSLQTSAALSTAGMISVDNKVDEKNAIILIPGSDGIIDNNGDEGSWGDDDEPVTPDPGVGEDKLPTIVGTSFNGNAFDFDNPLLITGEMAGAGVTLTVGLNAPDGGLQNVEVVMTSSDTELSGIFNGMGASDETHPWDLANPDTSLSEETKGMLTTLKVLDPQHPIKGETEYLFNIGGFMSFLTSPEVAGEYYTHTFKITIVDAHNHKVTKILTIHKSM